MAEVQIPEGLWDVALVPEGVVSNWFFRDGAAVTAGAVLAEVMAEKSVYEIAAPASGVLRILVEKDATVKPGGILARIEEDV